MKTLARILTVAILIVGMAASAQDAEIVRVRGKGTGADRADALKDAYRDAIERAVGMYVDAKQAVENEELVEDKILTQSNAYIEKYDVVKEKKRSNGLVEIQIDAEVKKSALAKKLSDIMPRQTFALGDEAQNFHSKVVTVEKRDADAAAMLGNVLEGVDPVKQMMKLSLADPKPIFRKTRDGKERIYYRFRFTVDDNKYYNEFLPSLLKVLDQIALKPARNLRFNPVAISNYEEDKRRYIAGEWDGGLDLRPIRVAADGRNEDYAKFRLIGFEDGGVYIDNVGFSDGNNAWCFSCSGVNRVDMVFDGAQRCLAKKDEPFRAVVMVKLNAAHTVVQAKEYFLPPECSEIVLKWQKSMLRRQGRRGEEMAGTSYNIVFTDGAGDEVSAMSVSFSNRALLNMAVWYMSNSKDRRSRGADRRSRGAHEITWWVSPMVLCDSAAWERWIGFDIPRDELPNVKSVSVELSER